MNKPFLYLAVPYSHSELSIRCHRFDIANKVAGNLIRRGSIVYSPISHTHPIALQCELPLDWSYWKRVDTAFISNSYLILVLMIDGWVESVGIKEEVALARELEIPVLYIKYDEDRDLVIVGGVID